MLYLDANIFLYTIDQSSPYHFFCKKLLQLAIGRKIKIATSVETIQEIIFFLRRIERLKESLYLSRNLLKIIYLLIPIDIQTIHIYLKLVEKYATFKKLASRDFIHLSACIQQNIKFFITYDKDFKIFKEIVVKTPDDVVNSFKD